MYKYFTEIDLISNILEKLNLPVAMETIEKLLQCGCLIIHVQDPCRVAKNNRK